jgi:hypothetical protein
MDKGDSLVHDNRIMEQRKAFCRAPTKTSPIQGQYLLCNGHGKALQGTWHENSNIETKIRFFLFTLHRVSSGSSSSLHHSASLLKRSELMPVSFTNNSFTTWKSK